MAVEVVTLAVAGLGAATAGGMAVFLAAVGVVLAAGMVAAAGELAAVGLRVEVPHCSR